MKCPICKDSILMMSERNGVEIDYCPQCRGIWLDRGELDKILEKAQTYSKEYNGNEYDKRDRHYEKEYKNDTKYYDHNYQGKRKKKNSFASEIFDIFGD